ncbi:MAG: class I SAM-dependent methyltransferase [Candidatus Dormibacteria bacterium]
MTLNVGGRQVRLATDAGVFSPAHVDPGTRFLLRRGPVPPAGGDLLDAGCGYGPIAVWLALRSPGARVWAVDVNERALELARANAASAGCDNVVVALPDQVPSTLRFAGLWSNPPIRVGLKALHPLLTGWLDSLARGAEATLVVHRHLGADSLQAWLRGHGYAAERRASHAGYRLLSVRPRPSSDENA